MKYSGRFDTRRFVSGNLVEKTRHTFMYKLSTYSNALDSINAFSL